MFNLNDNNIYKLIKKAKDNQCNSDDPMKRIIPNPIKFVYSFTLNSNNEPITEEQNKLEKEKQNLNNESNNIQGNPKINKDIKKESNELEPLNKQQKDIKRKKSNNSTNSNINNKYNNYDNKKETKILNRKIIKDNNIKEKELLNKKRNDKIENNNNNVNKKNINQKKKSSNAVKNNIIHQIYNSKNINLWENDDSDDTNSDNNKIKEKKNELILPIHKQIELINKCQNVFKKHDVAVKSEYDKDIDKGRVKKIHKNKIGFKKHKNYFQKISNKNINRQKRNGEL